MITYSKTASSSSEQQKSNPRIQGDERRRFSTLEEQAKVQKKKAWSCTQRVHKQEARYIYICSFSKDRNCLCWELADSNSGYPETKRLLIKLGAAKSSAETSLWNPYTEFTDCKFRWILLPLDWVSFALFLSLPLYTTWGPWKWRRGRGVLFQIKTIAEKKKGIEKTANDQPRREAAKRDSPSNNKATRHKERNSRRKTAVTVWKRRRNPLRALRQNRASKKPQSVVGQQQTGDRQTDKQNHQPN